MPARHMLTQVKQQLRREFIPAVAGDYFLDLYPEHNQPETVALSTKRLASNMIAPLYQRASGGPIEPVPYNADGIDVAAVETFAQGGVTNITTVRSQFGYGPDIDSFAGPSMELTDATGSIHRIAGRPAFKLPDNAEYRSVSPLNLNTVPPGTGSFHILIGRSASSNTGNSSFRLLGENFGHFNGFSTRWQIFSRNGQSVVGNFTSTTSNEFLSTWSNEFVRDTTVWRNRVVIGTSNFPRSGGNATDSISIRTNTNDQYIELAIWACTLPTNEPSSYGFGIHDFLLNLYGL